jgi:hypothetical protein
MAQEKPSAEDREGRELRMAERSILGSLAVHRTPKGRSLCVTDPLACVGADRAELGLALIGSRRSPKSTESLIGLLRYSFDGALAEDFPCYVLQAGKPAEALLKKIDPDELVKQCRSEVAQVVRGRESAFEGLQESAVCADSKSIREQTAELLKGIQRGQRCDSGDF